MSANEQRPARQEKHFLVQMCLRYLGPTSGACQTIVHGSLQLAQWEVKFYQNTDRALDLMQQGLNQQQVSQALWNESCREQDIIGVRTHHSIVVCTACAQKIIENFAGEASPLLSMFTTMLSSGSLLLMTDRGTDQPYIVGDLPGDLQECDILPLLG